MSNRLQFVHQNWESSWEKVKLKRKSRSNSNRHAHSHFCCDDLCLALLFVTVVPNTAGWNRPCILLLSDRLAVVCGVINFHALGFSHNHNARCIKVTEGKCILLNFKQRTSDRQHIRMSYRTSVQPDDKHEGAPMQMFCHLFCMDPASERRHKSVQIYKYKA